MRIKNGRVLDPKTGFDQIADVVIKDGRIEAVIPKEGGASGGDTPEAHVDGQDECVIDASGLTVAPGLIDVHVHFRDPGFTYKEDIASGAAAAAAGGYTTVICMANTKPVVDNIQTLLDIQRRAEELPIRILQSASVTEGLKGEKLVCMEELLQAGAIGFTDDGIPVMNEALMLSAMREAKRLGAVLSVHEEDPLLIERAGFNRTAPHGAEDVMVARDCMLALQTGARVNIQHISSGVSVELVRLAKKRGADVWAEATPHHFSLTETAAEKYGANAKMNPPLRTEQDRREIIAGLKDNTISIIATDHAPHTAEEKSGEAAAAPSGIIGLETALALGITNLVRTGYLDLMELIEKFTVNPAKLYGLNSGCLEKGMPADLVIFNETEQWTVGQFASKSANSPFVGQRLYGKVHFTVCGGQIVYKKRDKL